jgi:putative ABC transport system substrate-binding protein
MEAVLGLEKAMRRRDFIGGIAGSSAAWPLAGRAQQPAMPVIGLLGTESADVWSGRLRIFRQGLSETGFIERQNVAIEYRWKGGATDQYERLPALAIDLVRRKVTVIVTFAGPAPTLAAKAATTTIPIVFITSSDPVQRGMVASLNRPGGNVTGATTLNTQVAPKRLELLHEMVPQAALIGALVNPNDPTTELQLRTLAEAAHALDLKLQVLRARTDREIDDGFASLSQLQLGGLVIGVDSFLIGRSEQIAALALRHRLPAAHLYREFAAAGGLFSYGGLTEAYRLVGTYTGRILKGEKPADLPVQQVTKVELIINMRTAKVLGLTVPITLLGRADEVIE